MKMNALKNVSYKTMKRCVVCLTKLDKPVIELPGLPMTEIYVKERIKDKLGIVDQNLCLCKECGHAQLSNVIDSKILYGYTYSFRTSKSMSVKANDTFVKFINKVTQKQRFQTIMEIGCNDLYLLNLLEDKADNFIAIDPILKGREKELSTNKTKVIGDYFENISPEEYKCKGATLVLSSHVLEHIENPKGIIQSLLRNSNDNTLFIFQFPGFDRMVKDCRFDQIYHHHLHYFSLHSITYLLNKLGCELIDHCTNYHYWGSLMVAFRKTAKKPMNPLSRKISAEMVQRSYKLFAHTMENSDRYLKSIKTESIYGYGAGLQLPVLGYHLHNNFSSFKCILDDNEEKDGLYYLNLPVVIKHSSVVCSMEDSIVVITGINFARGILTRVIGLNPKRIFLPINVM